ncbi:MAG: choice-of-anchor D domain-containing protein [Candidatus Ratteibacteria bacterium]
MWIYRTKSQTPVISVIPDILDYGKTKNGKEELILVRNFGNADLIINSITIINTVDFNVKGDFPITIPPDNSTLIPVSFSPSTKGVKEGKLQIYSNDSGNPVVEINLLGECIQILGDIKEDEVVDITDVILCLRMAIALDQPDPEVADINDDNEVDIRDVIKILRKAIGLE